MEAGRLELEEAALTPGAVLDLLLPGKLVSQLPMELYMVRIAVIESQDVVKYFSVGSCENSARQLDDLCNLSHIA